MAAQYLPTIDFTASPTLCEFIKCQDYFQGVEGPPGSGKTIACVAKIAYYAMTQEPDKDGWRRTRWGIIRNTSVDLKTTTIQSWEEIFKPEYCGGVVYSAPIRHQIKIPPRGKPGDVNFVPGIDMLCWFLGLDKPKDVRKLKSFQITGAWINEATELDASVIRMLTSRTGRYPSVGQFDEVADGEDDDLGPPVGVGATWSGIIADTNAGDDDNWWHKFKENRLDADLARELKKDGRGWTFFKQPPAVLEVQKTGRGTGWEVSEPGFEPVDVPSRLVTQGAARYWCVNPNAENLRNLLDKEQYYLRQITNSTLQHIQRFLQVKTIYLADGMPFVPEYQDEVMSANLPYESNRPLMGGIDIGSGTLQPAAVIGQRGQFGDIRVLAELPMFDIGTDRFSTELAAFISTRFGVHHREVDFCIDPAGDSRDGLFETTWAQHLKSRGFKVRSAFSNDQKVRREAIATPMGRNVSVGGTFRPSSLMIDKSCEMLRAGLAGKWCLRRIQVAGTERYHSEPEKNRYSHVCDALGYFCLGVGEGRLLTHGGDPRRPGGGIPERRQVTPGMDFSPFGSGGIV
jgi:hypothetical protein